VIRTIIFDLGRVIIPFDFGRGYQALSECTGLSIDEIRARILATKLVHPFESGKVEPEDFVRQITSALGAQLDYTGFCDIWNSIFSHEPLFEESFLEALRARYRVLLLSNTNAIHFKMIRERYPIISHFDDYILSYEVGAQKPEDAIYRAALAKAECAAEECFFTDDIPDYVEAAKRHGIQALQFQSAAQVQDELRRLGVTW